MDIIEEQVVVKVRKYKAIDGTAFSDSKICENYDKCVEKAQTIMSKMRTRKEGSNFAVKQDLSTVKQCMEEFFNEVAKPLLKWDMASQWMDETIDGKRHPSHIGRLFDDNSEYPILYQTFFRFMCINMESGIEYEQPYYANHENEFKGTIE